ncbi:hypothetical protein HIO71_14165 [Chryseobacterium aquaticum]|uniref:Uncharacterized protein n=1 Tax=Chryseobacterium aquaticum TaxID=452084 RepID=A0A848N9C4_9FLAO|nr:MULTISPECIES: hypothetical protein [Chryseobacterium]NMR35328.1 hypothetical protein [Chryseobacterium aquaticum]NRQ47234.1 hypothetical protein [Chryseobacterium sp. C-204]
MVHFNFLSDLGKIDLLSKNELEMHFHKTGQWHLLVLDTSVCLDIVSLVKHGKNSKAEKTKIFNLIEYSQKNDIEHFDFFALLESSYNRNTLEIQYDKFEDFQSILYFAFNIPIKKFRRLDFDFYRDFHIKVEEKLDENFMRSLVESRLNPYYAGLLKICEIAQSGLSHSKAEKNILTFLDWMENDFGFIIGPQYRLALQVFGGDSKYRGMLKLGSKKEIIIKETLKTAWDILHAQISCNNELISELVDRNVRPIFVTKDNKLFDLMAPRVGSYMSNSSSKVALVDLTESPLIYSKDFIAKLNSRISKRFNERFFKEDDIDNDEVKKIIKELEDKIL